MDVRLPRSREASRNHNAYLTADALSDFLGQNGAIPVEVKKDGTLPHPVLVVGALASVASFVYFIFGKKK